MNLDHESMTKISLEVHNNLTKLNAKASNICVYGFHDTTSMALVGLWHIKEELAKGFLNFQISFPST